MLDISKAIEIIKEFEGFSSSPYLCPAGVPTIGYGSTYYLNGRKVTMKDRPISKERASAILFNVVHIGFLPGVLKICPGLLKYENRLNAIISFAYNVGLGNLRKSTLAKKINAEMWDEVPDELRKWIRGGGKILPGLVRRRECEVELFSIRDRRNY